MTDVAPARTGEDDRFPPVMALYDGVPGQERAVAVMRAAARRPVHAYLLTGAPGSGCEAAALALGTSLLCPDGGCGVCHVCQRGLKRTHPDIVVFERVGAFIAAPQAEEIRRISALSPVEAARKVLILQDFHLVDRAAPMLLKAIEEPPATTVFVITAEYVSPQLVTIASRCVRVELVPFTNARIESHLLAEGVDPPMATLVAAVSGGRLDRARLLAGDPKFVERLALWRSVPSRLDGSGYAIATLADELAAGIDDVLVPLMARQRQEMDQYTTAAKTSGDRSTARRRELEDRHKREQRRARADELRAGLAALAGAYRDRLLGADPLAARHAVIAAEPIRAAGEAIDRNPNETLLLQGLLVRLSTPL